MYILYPPQHQTLSSCERLRQYKTMKTIPKYDQASALGVSPQVVYTWYKGTSLPRADRLVQLAEMLEISPRELLDIFQQRLKPCTKYLVTEPEVCTKNMVTAKDLKSI